MSDLGSLADSNNLSIGLDNIDEYLNQAHEIDIID